MFFVIGPFPPPVHGMGKNLLIFYNALSEKVGQDQVTKIDISPGSLKRGFKYHSTKITKVLFGCINILLLGLINLRQRNVVYMPVDAGLGVVYSSLFSVISRLLGMTLFIHHRSYAYINKYSKLMKLFVFIGGSKATHIFLCQDMEDKYRNLYGFVGRSIVVSNAGHVEPISTPREKGKNTVVLGFMSNISEAKGIIETIDIFKRLKKQGYDVDLHIAGPFDNREAERLVEESIKDHQEIKILGPVHNNDKHQFFLNIDVFIFPTKYKNEAQPNVVFEAMSYFVRPITTNIGCLSSDFISGGVDVYSEKEQDFVRAASSKIEEYILNPEYLLRKQNSSHQIVCQMKVNAEKTYCNMVDMISNTGHL